MVVQLDYQTLIIFKIELVVNQDNQVSNFQACNANTTSKEKKQFQNYVIERKFEKTLKQHVSIQHRIHPKKKNFVEPTSPMQVQPNNDEILNPK